VGHVDPKFFGELEHNALDHFLLFELDLLWVDVADSHQFVLRQGFLFEGHEGFQCVRVSRAGILGIELLSVDVLQLDALLHVSVALAQLRVVDIETHPEVFTYQSFVFQITRAVISRDVLWVVLVVPYVEQPHFEVLLKLDVGFVLSLGVLGEEAQGLLEDGRTALELFAFLIEVQTHAVASGWGTDLSAPHAVEDALLAAQRTGGGGVRQTVGHSESHVGL